VKTNAAIVRTVRTSGRLVFKYGRMPIDVAQRSVRLFADEVMPALKALDPKLLDVALA